MGYIYGKLTVNSYEWGLAASYERNSWGLRCWNAHVVEFQPWISAKCSNALFSMQGSAPWIKKIWRGWQWWIRDLWRIRILMHDCSSNGFGIRGSIRRGCAASEHRCSWGLFYASVLFFTTSISYGEQHGSDGSVRFMLMAGIQVRKALLLRLFEWGCWRRTLRAQSNGKPHDFWQVVTVFPQGQKLSTTENGQK